MKYDPKAWKDAISADLCGAKLEVEPANEYVKITVSKRNVRIELLLSVAEAGAFLRALVAAIQQAHETAVHGESDS